VVHYISDRVMVMYLGQVAEIGPSDALFANLPTPTPGAAVVRAQHGPRPPHPAGAAGGRPAQPINPPSGCRFHPAAQGRCGLRAAVPGITQVQLHHSARCLVHEPAAAIRWPRRPAAFQAA
jgi:peptide/nickel transport system ATP-binding protein